MHRVAHSRPAPRLPPPVWYCASRVEHRIGLPDGFVLRIVMAAGVGVFLLVGLTLLLLGRPFLGYPPAWAGALILLIETAAMLSIAATLLLAFLGGQPQSTRCQGSC